MEPCNLMTLIFGTSLAHIMVPIVANTITTSIGTTEIFSIRKPSSESPKYIPIVMWHGMGDSCCNPFSLGSFKKFLEAQMPSVYIHSLQIGSNAVEDTENGFFMNVNKQVEIACNLLANDPQLMHGYNAVGFSQGGLFLRAVAQRCPSPPMLNLISIGGPQQGVYGLPHCLYPSHEYCDYIRKVLDVGAYWSWIQNGFVQAEYWHDPIHEEAYKSGSVFLADINNEKEINSTYRDNLLRLNRFILVKFEDDSMVEPKESEWFGFYASGQGKQVIPLQETVMFTEDRIGLKLLDQEKKLDFLSCPGDHLKFTKQWFIDNIINKYLK